MKITFNDDILVAMDFVKICNTFKSPIDLYVDNHYIFDNHYVLDAKSILGVSSFVSGHELDAVIHTDSSDENRKFENSMKAFAC